MGGFRQARLVLNMPYRVAQDFLRIEAVSTQGAQSATPADPIALVVTVVDSVMDMVLETVQVTDTPRLWRTAVGRWIFELNPALLTPGKTYTVTFTYSMHPGTSAVVRQNVAWQPIPLVPHDAGFCVLTGTLLDIQGLPLSNQTLVIEQYDDIVTLTRRTRQATVRTDAFGLWFIELPHDAIVRVVFNDVTKVIRIPRIATTALGSVPSLQLKSLVRVDRFGYPLPGSNPEAWAPVEADAPVISPPPLPTLPPGAATLSVRAETAVQPGQPSVGGELASASAFPLKATGLFLTATAPQHPASYITSGDIGLPDWTAATGSTDLLPGATYYLGVSPGTMVTIPPALGAVLLQVVGQAIDARTMRLALGSFEQALYATAAPYGQGMPLGITNAYLLTVGGTTYDLRRVTHVGLRTSTTVYASFDWAPTSPIVFLRSVFEPAYQAALVALGGTAGPAPVTGMTFYGQTLTFYGQSLTFYGT